MLRTLLSWLLHPADRRFAMADLDEEFSERVAARGAFRARWWYRRQVVTSLIPAVRGRVIARRATGWARTRTGSPLADLGGDLRLGARALMRSPLMSLLTVLSVGVGIGGVSIVTAVFDTLVLQPPVGLEAPSEVVSIYRSEPEKGGGHPFGASAYADYLDIAEHMPALAQVAAVASRAGSLATDVHSPVSVFTEAVTPNYFELTGTRPELGRLFVGEVGRDGSDPRVAVLGFDMWQSLFSGRTDALGSTIRIDGLPYTVIGVAPDGMRSRSVPLETDVWVPLWSEQGSAPPTDGARTDRRVRALGILGRLGEGENLRSAQAQATVLAGRLADEHPESWGAPPGEPHALTVVSERQSRTNPRARTLFMGVGTFFFTVAGLILALACANVAGLFVARAHRRRAELAVRASLGATRSRIVTMLLAEGIWPGLLGGALGIAIAAGASRRLGVIALPIDFPLRLDIRITPLVLTVTVGVALAATLAFSLLPAIGASRREVTAALKEAGGSRRRRFWTARNGLVMAQCAMSAILVVGAMLFVRTLQAATAMDLGFDPDGIAAVTHRFPEDLSAREGAQAIRDLRRRLSAQPGIEEVAISSSLELTLFQTLAPLRLEVDGYEPPGGEAESVFHNAVTPGYLQMLAVPMLSGRTIEETDVAGAVPVAVVNEEFARRYWPGEEPVGRTFVVGRGDLATRFEVVGLARNGTYLDFDDGPMPYFWSSIYQDYSPHVGVAVRGAGPAQDRLAVLRAEVVPQDGAVQLLPPSTLRDQVSFQFIHLRVLSTLLGWGGLFGLLLASLGIYGVVSFAVTQRTREMAIRVALGADRRGVLRSVALDGLRLAAVGLTIGIGLVVPAAHLIRVILHGVRPTDPLALAVSFAVLLSVALLASVIPAHRATRIEPMRALRAE